jgi:hypothetical protein
MKMTGMDYLKIVFGILVAWAYTEIAHYVVPMDYRITGLIVAYTLIFLSLFALIKPAQPFALSRWMSLRLTIIGLIIILIEDLGLKHVPPSHLVRGTTTILGTTIIAPFVVGWVYSLLARKK